MLEKKELSTFRLPQLIGNLEGILNGFRAYQVFKAAFDLQLFALLDKEPGLSREAIATRLAIDGRYIRSFLLALTELGLLCERNGQFTLSEMAKYFLVRESPFYQGDWIEQDLGTASKWNQFAKTLHAETDTPAPAERIFDAEASLLALGQHSLRGEVQAVALATAATAHFAEAKTMLDLGGKHGLYAIALCQMNKNLHATLLNKPAVTPITRRIIDGYGLADRMQTVSGDLWADAIGRDYDIIIASHVFYERRDAIPALLKKLREALKVGGLLVLHHWFCATGCVPTNGLKELDRAFWSCGHPLCHVEKFSALLHAHGFCVVSSQEIATMDGSSQLHLAVKEKFIPLSPTAAPDHVAQRCEK